MLCPHAFQSSFGPLMEFYWPVRSVWPRTRPLSFPQEMLLRSMQEMKNSVSLLEKFHEQTLEEMDRVPCSLPIKPFSCQMEKDGDKFTLTLDTKDFSPEELSVKQVGRKLRVSGKTEKKHEDGKGSYSYKCQEFRQDVELPEDVKPDAVTCSLSDGRLQIQAPRQALPGVSERVLPINIVPSVTTSTSRISEAGETTANPPTEGQME